MNMFEYDSRYIAEKLFYIIGAEASEASIKAADDCIYYIETLARNEHNKDYFLLFRTLLDSLAYAIDTKTIR